MMASVPSIALGSPPLTGASRKSTPLAAQAAPTFCATSGLIELMSTTMRPGARAFENAARAEHGVLHLRAVGQHRDHDRPSAPRVLGGRRSARRAGRREFVQRRRGTTS